MLYYNSPAIILKHIVWIFFIALKKKESDMFPQFQNLTAYNNKNNNKSVIIFELVGCTVVPKYPCKCLSVSVTCNT